MTFENSPKEHVHCDIAVCPYCEGKQHEDEWDDCLVDDNTTYMYCGHCGREFNIECHAVWTWTTSPLEEE